MPVHESYPPIFENWDDIPTDWYMDIKVYTAAAGHTALQTQNDPALDPELYSTYTYGPLTIERTQNSGPPSITNPGGLKLHRRCTLKDFFNSVNNMLSNGADANDWPEFRLFATPYLMSEDPTDPSNLTAIMPPVPEIKSAPMRKLNSPAGASSWLNAELAHPWLAYQGSMSQMLIRYDITAAGPLVDSRGSIYYGFKIEWHHGENITSWSVSEGLGPKGLLTVKQKSDAPIVALPYSLPKQTIVQDDLPLPPNIKFIPYMGVSNKLLIFMNTNTGVYDARPVVILESDLNKLVNLFFNQKGADPRWTTAEALEAWLTTAEFRDPAAALAYKHDDPVNKYQIFRTTTKPTSYRDFDTVGAPHAAPNGNISLGIETTGVTYIDNIEPNTKYYYCIRAIDVHKNFSNPTYVYEVEMVDNDGQIFIVMEPIVFNNSPKRKNTKVGRRFIYIEPSLQNLTFDQTAITTPTGSITPSTTPGSNRLGHVTDEPVWDQTFKVRVTSKKTSRQFDINLTFKNTGVITPNE